MKKVYVNSGEVTSIEIVFVHPEFHASAGGAKDARNEGIKESRILIQVDRDSVYIVDPRIRTISCSM